jgi:hydroxymethylglutaryl-CoA lyase
MDKLIIHEVGLRDGLQMESAAVPLETKAAWVELLIAAGVDIIQLGSFVHPAKVPQMADTDALFRYFTAPERKRPDVVFSGLVLNEKGLERGEACGVEMYCMGVSASETHSHKNTGMTTQEAVTRILATAGQAQSAGKPVQLSVQSAFGCGFEGPIPAERVLDIVRRYLEAGFARISLADTAGHAYPEQVTDLFRRITALAPEVELTCHFHNTYGLGLANCLAAIQAGVRSLEAAAGGLGGCPFTKQAAGNVCTEDLVYWLQRAGRRADIELEKLLELARALSVYFDRALPGLVHKSGPITAGTA